MYQNNSDREDIRDLTPNIAIRSICFHPTQNIIFYAIQHEIVIWNWIEDTKLATLSTHPANQIKYDNDNIIE